MVQSKFQITKEELSSKTKNLLERLPLVYTKKDYDAVEILKKDLLLLAHSLYPDDTAEAYLFGSRLTGLAQRNSDVDFYLDIGDTFSGSISEDVEEQAKRVRTFEKAMRQDQQAKFEEIVSVTTGRVPILKFKHGVTGLKCDLSFCSGMSTKNSELVKFYLDWDPRVKYVVVGVRIFMEENGLADRNQFTSYAQVWLALFYLMQPDIRLIPSLLCLRYQAAQTERSVMQSMVEYWDCTVPNIKHSWQVKWIKKKCKLSGEELLEKFFTFYSSLLPLGDKFVLTTYNGMRTMKRKVFFKVRNPIRRFYDSYLAEKGKPKYLAMRKKYEDDITGRFYLQDPFHQLKNLTKMSNAKVSVDQMHLFVECCRVMAKS